MAIEIQTIKDALATVDRNVDAWGELGRAAAVQRDLADKAEALEAAAKGKLLDSMAVLQTLLGQVAERNPLATDQDIVDLANNLTRTAKSRKK